MPADNVLRPVAPRLARAPGIPADTPKPFLLKFILNPGKIFLDFLKLNPIFNCIELIAWNNDLIYFDIMDIFVLFIYLFPH